MTRSEMIKAVHQLTATAGSEEELNAIRYKLRLALPNGNLNDMLYYPDEKRTEEQVVDEAIRREASFKADLSGKAS